MVNGQLAESGQSLALTPSLQQGLTAITTMAFVSFFSSSVLFLYLTYKLIWHYMKTPRARPEGHIVASEQNGKSLQRRVDFALGIDTIFTDGQEDAQQTQERSSGDKDRKSSTTTTTIKRQPPNQFLILIFNLLLADMHQGIAFFLNAEWLRYDEVRVGTPTCFTQGLFVSTGDLASSCFITLIAVHTYLSVVRRYKMPHRVLYTVIAGAWLFVYTISVVPVLATANGAHYGGFFVRAGAWCWMNIAYSNLRLLTHYLFIFIAIAVTSGLYTTIFIHIRREEARAHGAAVSDRTRTVERPSSQLNLAHNPAFLIYPVIYVLCTAPLALGRIASMAGADVPLGYMCFAGAMIASNGMFDCMLFGTTRNVIVFASKHDVDSADTGLATFRFMQTAQQRAFGNMVWVQGGNPHGPGGGAGGHAEDKTTGGWWSWQRLGGGSDTERPARGDRRPGGARSVSQESLRGTAAIQMDTVTSVVVEMEHGKDRDPRYPNPSGSTSPSVNSTEKDYGRI
ncbi:G protein-coupled glucose receptor regulating Gpa2-domain-containing protein [Emericellopsis atlantica]|uniref:G protein-coupled glucose receptor regulating Gpa2-domain-containing protein n=1 Tax=Emericellopsis atlantica TaxID=2614577 RepID=A0A9P8CMI7_9HYPO|nr:G protein-coupled glucose receptor regulating Gpa2-domain-containing protein [Emericellopsis atlantica]KAG9250726.1 G protein-coupled glucose receptor regulating Gpa2-domain-containing protein [Emericellopsis atlantica]